MPASENGQETVIGTALMRIGENSRTVAAAVDARMDQIRRALPPGIVVQTVLDRTRLVEATTDRAPNHAAKHRTGDNGCRVTAIFANLAPDHAPSDRSKNRTARLIRARRLRTSRDAQCQSSC